MQASDLSELVVTCCSDVLDAMYFSSVLEATHLPIANEEDVAAMIPLSATDQMYSLAFHGTVSGQFGIHLGRETATRLAGNFLGESEGTLSEREVGEVVGELSNMLCGSIVSRIEGKSTFALSHPEAVLSMPALSDKDSAVHTFHTDDGVITTWVVVEGIGS